MEIRALGLFGGGLDSLLACELLDRQQVQMSCIHFRTGFARDDRARLVDELVDRREGGRSRPPVEIVEVTGPYVRQVVLEARYGYGSAMNPCLDCRIFMLRRAAELARERGIDLLFTGEVVGQRAIDQSHAALQQAEREAGVAGRVLRPLSAGLLEPTAAERAGRPVLDRAVRLHGRSRRAQFELARRFGLERFPTPSGGCCLLADRSFARRLRDAITHRRGGTIGPADVERLKRGRHFRLAWNLKVVVGRNEQESTWLGEHAGGDWICQAAGGRGALGLVEGELSADRLEEVGSLVARYSAGRPGPVPVVLRRGVEDRRLTARPADEARLRGWRV